MTDAAELRVVAVQESLVTIALPVDGGPTLAKNELVHIIPRRPEGDHPERLKAEVLRIRGRLADAQVYERTRGVAVGDVVEPTGALLSIQLGPGLLGQVYDGLQNSLAGLAAEHGTFLPRGVEAPALPAERHWRFTPAVREGDRVLPGGALGSVPEAHLAHRILVPFDEPAPVRVTWIQEGMVTSTSPVARYRRDDGSEHTVTLARPWPIRRPLSGGLVRRRFAERRYPDAPLITRQRLIDTFFPIARGGTACIPGPFGAGKTVLQNLISRHADVDVVVVVACGERAGEVVETITEFPRLTDPRTGGSLMDRTVIVCNTSSMPVAARESSIYTGITIGEYYRQMGYDVLLIADSTSRWAQAMRETSGRLEEIPGEEAYPAYLDSTIRALYERAGKLALPGGDEGSLTLIGTVSPAGGNFQEPVTQATLATVKTFLGLSADRAYKRFYPALDPLLSWSRYRSQLAEWFAAELHPQWMVRVERLHALLREGEEIARMMEVTGEEGVSLPEFVTRQKALFVDRVYLQQDAFDPVDAAMPLERQRESFMRVHDLVGRDYPFADREQARSFFTALTRAYRNLNYARADSPEHARHLAEIDALVAEHATKADTAATDGRREHSQSVSQPPSTGR